MKKVITYGTFDLFHQGHYNLLKRAKDLGDWLIVGVTTDNFDLERGKMNTCDNVMDRIAAVQATGLADQIVIEEFIDGTAHSMSSFLVKGKVVSLRACTASGQFSSACAAAASSCAPGVCGST